MMYKMIVLQFLEQQAELYDQLLKSRQLLPALDRYAQELKDCHQAWKNQLSQAKPESDPSQIASEALELALKELESRLPSGSRPDDSEPLSLDAAIAFIRRTRAA